MLQSFLFRRGDALVDAPEDDSSNAVTDLRAPVDYLFHSSMHPLKSPSE
jgi:hypothetical protein